MKQQTMKKHNNNNNNNNNNNKSTYLKPHQHPISLKGIQTRRPRSGEFPCFLAKEMITPKPKSSDARRSGLRHLPDWVPGEVKKD